MLEGTFDSTVSSVSIRYIGMKSSWLFTPFHTLQLYYISRRGANRKVSPWSKVAFIYWWGVIYMAGSAFLEASVAKTLYWGTHVPQNQAMHPVGFTDWEQFSFDLQSPPVGRCTVNLRGIQSMVFAVESKQDYELNEKLHLLSCKAQRWVSCTFVSKFY